LSFSQYYHGRQAGVNQTSEKSSCYTVTVKKLCACALKLGVCLDPAQLEQFALYYSELIDWNNRFNLTAITDYDGVQLKHFCDSLTAALAFKSMDTDQPLRIIDVGTGAGFPGVPLKIVLPGISLTLLESTAKKAAFLLHLQEKMGIRGVEIVTGRAEEAAHEERYREKFDVVLSRAVAPLPSLVELCLPFCSIGGRFIAQKKGNISNEIDRAARAIRLMGGVLIEIKKIDWDEFTDDRVLVVIDKVSPTPPNYPRRPGTPAKTPLV